MSTLQQYSLRRLLSDKDGYVLLECLSHAPCALGIGIGQHMRGMAPAKLRERRSVESVSCEPRV